MSTTDVSDADLVHRSREGDTGAFGVLVERHQRAVYRAALAALRSPVEAEDVAQEALLAAWSALGEFRGNASFRTWVLAITWRKAINRRRRVGRWLRRFTAPPETPESESAWDPPGPGASPEQTTMQRELDGQIRRLIRRLPARLRDTLLLSAAGEYSYEEIGAMLGVPAGTVKWRVSEARRQIRAGLARVGYGT